MERLIDDILDSDPMRTVNGNHGPCEVGGVVKRVLAEVDLGRDHPLEVTIAVVRADVDPAHLERIVDNLLINARQHVPPGVPIWVTVAPGMGGVVFSVEDAGPGVPLDMAGSIFEPFRRARTAAGSGLGLGLSLVARFAQLHGGRAWAEERRGGGAAFRVFLPSTGGLRINPGVNPGSDRVTSVPDGDRSGRQPVTTEKAIAFTSTRSSGLAARQGGRVSLGGRLFKKERNDTPNNRYLDGTMGFRYRGINWTSKSNGTWAGMTRHARLRDNAPIR